MNNATPARHRPGRGSLASQLALACLLALAPTTGHAQTKTATPVQIQTLDFGTFTVLANCNNCTITISAAGVRSASAAIKLSSTNMGRPARFYVTCSTGSCGYTPTVTGAPVIRAGTVNMTMNNFTFSKSPTNTPSTLSVGARLTIPNSTAARGSFISTAFTLATAAP